MDQSRIFFTFHVLLAAKATVIVTVTTDDYIHCLVSPLFSPIICNSIRSLKSFLSLVVGRWFSCFCCQSQFSFLQRYCCSCLSLFVFCSIGLPYFQCYFCKCFPLFCFMWLLILFFCAVLLYVWFNNSQSFWVFM